MAIRMGSQQFETVIANSLDELLTDSVESIDIILKIFNNVVEELTISILTQFQLPLIVSLFILIMTLLYSFVYKRLRT